MEEGKFHQTPVSCEAEKVTGSNRGQGLGSGGETLMVVKLKKSFTVCGALKTESAVLKKTRGLFQFDRIV